MLTNKYYTGHVAWDMLHGRFLAKCYLGHFVLDMLHCIMLLGIYCLGHYVLDIVLGTLCRTFCL